jgi:UDP-GlcNAc3NAcA epimerase
MLAVSVVGARPQFVKLAAMCRALASRAGVRHHIVHTGQHYDAAMSDVFFRDLDIPEPHHNLGVGSGSHGEQTAEMLKGLDRVLIELRPDWVILYGDTNSTLAGALSASKLHLRTAHVEAGLRSFNRRMPEEINRIVADQLSDLLLCPTETAMANLKQEGILQRAVLTGDLMYDAALYYAAKAESQNVLADSRWLSEPFALATVHRAENTDDPDLLRAIMSGLDRVSAELLPVVLPVHPRTRKALATAGCTPRHVQLVEPMNYLEMITMERHARLVLTDSGGVQKEAYFMHTPCVTIREETEWVETLENGCNVLVGGDPDRMFEAARNAPAAGPWALHYGSGDAGARMVEALTCCQDHSARTSN